MYMERLNIDPKFCDIFTRPIRVTRDFRVTNAGEPTNRAFFSHVSYQLSNDLARHIVEKQTQMKPKAQKKLVELVQREKEQELSYH